MTAEIVAIGTEILLGDIADTNSQALGRLLAEFGIAHTRRTTVGDNLARCTEAIRDALRRAELVFTIGGLGPTEDDVTRDAIAAALADELVHDAEAERRLRGLMAERKRPWVDSMSRQAMRPASAKMIPNDVGTAPGLCCEKGGKTVIALPGPEHEFRPMLHSFVHRFLAAKSEGTILSKTLRIVGIPEAAVEARVSDLVKGENPTVAPLVKLGEVHLRVTARAKTQGEAEEMIAPIVADIKARFGRACYGEDETDLASEVLDLLREKKRMLAVAESCTGGMLSERITSVPGSSEAFLGAFVAYSDEMKAKFLGLAKVDLEKYGAVSEAAARQMAEGARRAMGADYGIGITGIAGPGGGTEEKPVGLVFISICGPRGTEVRQERYGGDRKTVQFRATQTALVMLREELLLG